MNKQNKNKTLFVCFLCAFLCIAWLMQSTSADQLANSEDILVQAQETNERGRELVPDENFYKYLINRPEIPENFGTDDLKNLKTISYNTADPSKRINDLTGIAYMTNIETLYLNDHNIQSLEPMRNAIYPNLRAIEFNNWKRGTNAIHDLSLFTAERFPALDEQLMLNNNGITDTHLQTLPVTGGLTRYALHLQNNKLENIEHLANFPDLKRLTLDFNNISDVRPLSGLTKISYLGLGNNKISDVSPLANIQMSGSRPQVWLNNNQIVDFSPLGDMKAAIYARYYSDAEPYLDPTNNEGQRYTNPEYVIGDKKTGKVTIKSLVKDPSGTIVPMQIEQQDVTEIELTLDSSQMSYSYSINYHIIDTFWFIGTIEQPILWWDGPVFEANALDMYVGDSFDPLQGIQVYDEQQQNLLDKVEVVQSNVNPNKVGTYEVTYKVEDQKGYVTEFTRVVKVHGLPEIQAPFQRYELGNPNIDYSLKHRIEATWLEANDTPGLAPIQRKLSDEQITYTVVNGNPEFSDIGIYTLAYQVQNQDGKTCTKEVQVLINNKHSVMDQLANAIIGADDLIYTFDQVQSLTKQDIISDANVHAFLMDRNSQGEIHEFLGVNQATTVHEAQWQTIKNVSKQGGMYELLYTVKLDHVEVSKKINVTILGESTSIFDEYGNFVLNGHDFELTYDEAKQLQQSQAIQFAKVEVCDIDRNEIVAASIEANANQLATIQKVGKEGGIFKLAFTASVVDEIGHSHQQKIAVHVTVNKALDLQAVDDKTQRQPSENHGNMATVAAGDSTNILGMKIILLFALCLGTFSFWQKKFKSFAESEPDF
ncbi:MULTISPECIES: immunoglobulin-like domain-containing protein [unclassified Breznakia]|uniref:immunoglobulin-like domain-containing protein n=1 Tax=unclassified Breznakia TaxID=2623764 RepID=UPI0024732F39|nr:MULTISPECIES: immunoglobulin-like domain-containing protein [unclassified Breznakia]MDH6365861.1 hypothetical protein [Breznakia sp. PH1-1]MDH6403207.1 hypothetical protein [Breznakia sp. PF1-11]MDH6410916.1 hypothetical protein [Breznakia sp. PFB1-11]MDH6413027.1 hypothetical protein [Breznakia sp. PFB1-14]MDH6415395.1 hypothetical protein [Breznakia sp. PFB1-4]